MKKALALCSLIFALSFFSCTDVIDVAVPTAPPRLVVEASLDWQKFTPGNQQSIKLSISTPFFENLDANPASGAMVKVTRDSDGAEYLFTESIDGTYVTSSFEPLLGEAYTLQIDYEGETYIARETVQSVVRIDDVFQTRENGFDKDALEVNVIFTDPANIANYYLIKFQRRGDLLPTLFDIKDEFTDGNAINIIYEKLSDEDTGETEFEPGDVVDIELLGISEQYYDYIRLLIEQSGSSGDIFSTIPAEIRGNCINLTDPENYAFGYFRLTEVDVQVYTFE